MIDDERIDPIKISIDISMDRNLASFNFGSDNSPKNSNNFVPLRGRVNFGDINRTIGKRDYKIAICNAFLEIKTRNCNFENNLSVNMQAQKPKTSQKTTIKQENKARLDLRMGANLSPLSPSLDTNAALAFGKGSQQTNTLEQQFALYRVHYTSGGFKFGDDKHGDLYHEGGCLAGDYMINSDWGNLVPNPGELKYGALLRLAIRKGGLSVTRNDSRIYDSALDKLTDAKSEQQNAGFELLKSLVAGWVLQNDLQIKNMNNGYDEIRGELVLATGTILVNLKEFSLLGSGSEVKNLDHKTPATLPEPTPKAKRHKASKT
jgi:hypothetical protein